MHTLFLCFSRYWTEMVFWRFTDGEAAAAADDDIFSSSIVWYVCIVFVMDSKYYMMYPRAFTITDKKLNNEWIKQIINNGCLLFVWEYSFVNLHSMCWTLITVDWLLSSTATHCSARNDAKRKAERNGEIDASHPVLAGSLVGSILNTLWLRFEYGANKNFSRVRGSSGTITK